MPFPSICTVSWFAHSLGSDIPLRETQKLDLTMNLERTQCITASCVYYWKYQPELLKQRENEKSGEFWKVLSSTLQITFCWIWFFNRIITKLCSVFLSRVWLPNFYGFERALHWDKKKKKSTVNMPAKRWNTQTNLQHDSAVSCVLILVSTTHLSLQRASCHSLLPQPGKGQDAENPLRKLPLFFPL